MIKVIIENIKRLFGNIDKKILKILKAGFYFCFCIAIISVIILFTYLFFIHNDFIYQIGILIFQLSICYTSEFIVSAFAVDTIIKQLN